MGNANWKSDELDYRLCKMVLENLLHDNLLTETEVAQVLQHLRETLSALIAEIEVKT